MSGCSDVRTCAVYVQFLYKVRFVLRVPDRVTPTPSCLLRYLLTLRSSQGQPYPRHGAACERFVRPGRGRLTPGSTSRKLVTTQAESVHVQHHPVSTWTHPISLSPGHRVQGQLLQGLGSFPPHPSHVILGRALNATVSLSESNN